MNPQLQRRVLKVSFVTLVVLVSSAIGTLGFIWSHNQYLAPAACPAEPLDDPAAIQLLDRLLASIVHDDGVDYGAARTQLDTIESLVCWVGSHEPRSDWKQDLAFHINAYNLLVIYGVLRTDVAQTIHEVHVPLVPFAGYGFFYSLRFQVEGQRINLYQLEHESIRARYADARIHAALNCASASCPPLAPWAFKPDELDAQLQQVAHSFASVGEHVRPDEDARTLNLSSIYLWYRSDFETHATSLALDPSVPAWIVHMADEADDNSLLQQAVREGWPVVWLPYDWSLNAR